MQFARGRGGIRRICERVGFASGISQHANYTRHRAALASDFRLPRIRGRRRHASAGAFAGSVERSAAHGRCRAGSDVRTCRACGTSGADREHGAFTFAPVLYYGVTRRSGSHALQRDSLKRPSGNSHVQSPREKNKPRQACRLFIVGSFRLRRGTAPRRHARR